MKTKDVFKKKKGKKKNKFVESRGKWEHGKLNMIKVGKKKEK